MGYIKNYIVEMLEYMNNKNIPDNKIWEIARRHPMVSSLDYIINYKYNNKLNKYQIYTGFNKTCRLADYIPPRAVERNKLLKHRRILVNNIFNYIKRGAIK